MPEQKCDTDCKDMNGIKKTLYGEDGTGGIVACSKKLDRNKVSWKSLATVAGIIIPVIIVTYWNIRSIDAEEVKSMKKHHEIEMSEVRAIAIDQSMEIEKVKVMQQVVIKNQDEFKKQMEKQAAKQEKMKLDIIKAIRDK